MRSYGLASQAFSYVKTQLLDTDSTELGSLIDAEVPMIDPHELLNWLWIKQMIWVSDADLEHLDIFIQ